MTATLVLSGISSLGTPPSAAKARVWAPIQSASAGVQLAWAYVKLEALWDGYIERCPEGYRYSRLCELYRGWASRLSVTMRQVHIGGDKLFVVYAGDTVPVIVDRLAGQVRAAQIFVAVMGAPSG
jgi:transposase